MPFDNQMEYRPILSASDAPPLHPANRTWPISQAEGARSFSPSRGTWPIPSTSGVQIQSRRVKYEGTQPDRSKEIEETPIWVEENCESPRRQAGRGRIKLT